MKFLHSSIWLTGILKRKIYISFSLLLFLCVSLFVLDFIFSLISSGVCFHSHFSLACCVLCRYEIGSMKMDIVIVLLSIRFRFSVAFRVFFARIVFRFEKWKKNASIFFWVEERIGTTNFIQAEEKKSKKIFDEKQTHTAYTRAHMHPTRFCFVYAVAIVVPWLLSHYRILQTWKYHSKSWCWEATLWYVFNWYISFHVWSASFSAFLQFSFASFQNWLASALAKSFEQREWVIVVWMQTTFKWSHGAILKAQI